MSIIRPSSFEKNKVENGRVLVDSEDDFLAACDAFLCHHADFRCANYQKKAYRTSCTCLKGLLSGTNSNHKVQHLCASMWHFFSRTKETQNLVMKEWLRTALYSGKKYQRDKPNMSFVLPGVFQDAAPQPTTKEDTRLINNIHPYKVCLNSLRVIFNYGYGKIKTLKETMDLPGLK